MGKKFSLSFIYYAWNRLFLACLLILALLSCSKQPALPPLASDAVILAFGDSLTFGTGAGKEQSYPAVLAGLIGRTVVNAGIPGEVSEEGLKRLPELLEDEQPSLLILCHGGNDLLRRQDQGQLRSNIRQMIELAKQKDIAVVLIAVPEPGLSLKPPALYQELAKEFELPIETKTIASLMTKSELKSDQVHPNAAGYQRMAETMAELLRKSGALP